MFIANINNIICISEYFDSMKIFILIGLLVLKVLIYEKCLMAEERMLKMCYSSNAKILFLRTYKASHS